MTEPVKKTLGQALKKAIGQNLLQNGEGNMPSLLGMFDCDWKQAYLTPAQLNLLERALGMRESQINALGTHTRINRGNQTMSLAQYTEARRNKLDTEIFVEQLMKTGNVDPSINADDLITLIERSDDKHKASFMEGHGELTTKELVKKYLWFCVTNQS